jgi:hypothetical protein
MIKIDEAAAVGLAKERAMAQIEAEATAARDVMVSPGMARVYARKSQERMALLSAVQMQAPVDMAQFPMLAASVGIEVPATGNDQADLMAVAVLVGQREAAIAVLDGHIERKRLRRKAAVKAATTLAEIKQA